MMMTTYVVTPLLYTTHSVTRKGVRECVEEGERGGDGNGAPWVPAAELKGFG